MVKKQKTLVVIYTAKKIITMNILQPTAKSVAVLNGKCYAVGDIENIIQGLKLAKLKYKIDRRFEKQTILPGFIEAHSHPMITGLFWRWIYVGANVRFDPNGKPHGGYKQKKDVINILKGKAKKLQSNQAKKLFHPKLPFLRAHIYKYSSSKLVAKLLFLLQKCGLFKVKISEDSAIIAWGYDPSILENSSVLSKQDLNTVSNTNPVIVINLNSYTLYVNDVVLNMMGLNTKIKIEGVVKDKNNRPTGELHGMKVITLLLSQTDINESNLILAMENVAKIAQKSGCTTLASLALGIFPKEWDAMIKVSKLPNYPVRLAAYRISNIFHRITTVSDFNKLKANNNNRLCLIGIKFITDGSIQNYTANMKWPYYYNGHDNGHINMKQKKLTKQLKIFYKNKIPCALHVNGNAAIDYALDAIENALQVKSLLNHRSFRLEHCQTVNAEQLERISNLGININFFINHIYYWGNFHSLHSLGYDRASVINPLASSLKSGIKFSLHSDSPVTPIDPLFMVWVAVKRQTISGKILGQNETISVFEALKAVTLNAAYLLNEDNIKGSIEQGKLADFVIIEKDPLSVNIDEIKDIKVIATMMNGKIFSTPPIA